MLEIRKAVARVRKKNIQAEVKKRKIRINCQQKRCFILANLEVIYSEIGGEGSLKRGLTAPTSNPPAAKVASQGDAHVRTDTQIKFLYYALWRLSTLKFSVGSFFLKFQILRTLPFFFKSLFHLCLSNSPGHALFLTCCSQLKTANYNLESLYSSQFLLVRLCHYLEPLLWSTSISQFKQK